MLTDEVQPSFAELDGFMREVIDSSLESWKFRKRKRRGIGNRPPVDLVQAYQRVFRGGRTFVLQFSVSGAFLPLKDMWISAGLYSLKDKHRGVGPGYYYVYLPCLLWDAGVESDFDRRGWLIGNLLSQHRSSSQVEILKMLETHGLPWLEKQASFPGSTIEPKMSQWAAFGSHPSDALIQQ